MIGQTLSHYRITARIGAGGMGEVYRATDTSLGREVAIKVLPPEVAGDAERLARFRREAHLLACLNHPHIAAIYGLEEAAGQPFLALELVEGEDLKQRLDRGAIPVDEALEIALQVAEALEEAHGKGIVHRDLKPANVKLTADGKVKVLDFGLAKAWAGDGDGSGSSSSALSQSPTLARTGTVAGVILGTAAYMSPEQARGKTVDRRADVWSFGVLLWEMLTGQALFAGDTVTDVIAAVVTKEPDLGALPAKTPAAVRRLIARCLRKDPRQRLPDIGAARLDLQEAIAGTATSGSPDGELAASGKILVARLRRERFLWGALALASAVVAGSIVHRATPERQPNPPVAHFAFDASALPDTGGSPAGISFGAPALSPDGRSLVFPSSIGSAPGPLRLRTLDSLETRGLPGTEGGRAPFWSADATAVAFVAGDELKRITLASGTVQKLCLLPRAGFGGGSWNAAGTILFSAGSSNAALFTVQASGGEPEPVAPAGPAHGDIGSHYPQFLGDGRHFLYTLSGAQPADFGVYVTSLDAPGERKRLLPGWTGAVYARPGYLLQTRNGVITARRFDERRLELAGDPVPIASSVAASWGIGLFSASQSGVLAWLDDEALPSRLQWRGRDGRTLGTIGEPRHYGHIALSPDASRVAALVWGDNTTEVWVIDVARGIGSRVASGWLWKPVWSPDGQELACDGDGGIVRERLRGTPTTTPLAIPRDYALIRPESWAANGTLLYVTVGARAHTLWARPMSGGEASRKVLDASAVADAQLSPDGRWLAHASVDSLSGDPDHPAVYVEPFGREGERVRVSPQSGWQPRWRGDGKELFYVSPTGLMSVDVRAAADRLTVTLPKVLMKPDDVDMQFERWDDQNNREYAVTADGQRFLFKAVGRKRPQRMHVLVNWPSLLGQGAKR